MTTSEIVRKYLGIPYKLKGRDLSGLDCWGFLMLAYHDLGAELREIPDAYDQFGRLSGKTSFIGEYASSWDEVLAPQAFDLVTFHIGNGIINHCGLYLESDKFIHCGLKGVIVSRLSDESWSKRFHGFYRMKHV